MKRIIPIFVIILFTTSCIKNDIPYPIVHGKIVDFMVKGQVGQPVIADNLRLVSVKVREEFDLHKLIVEKIELSDQTTANLAVGDEVDLSDTMQLVLTTYQEYVWQLIATHLIEYRALVEKQIGDALIDPDKRTVLIFVDKSAKLEKIKVLDLKLGPKDASYKPDPKSSKIDWTQPVEFQVSSGNSTEIWTVTISKSGQTLPAEAWAKHAVLHAAYKGSNAVHFEYRRHDQSAWNKLEPRYLTVNDGFVTDTLRGLEPSCKYFVRLIEGSMAANEIEFSTEAAPVVPNLSFDEWHLDGKTWFPWSKNNPNPFWSTGNEGLTAAIVGKDGNTTPVDGAETSNGTGYAVKLETVSAPIVNLAAGNLFVGDFKLDVFSPGSSVKFGKPFTGRPLTLSGYFKYFPKTIDVAEENSPLLGQMDQCHIYIILEDWQGADKRPETPKRIAYGEFKTSQQVSEYTNFNIRLAYTNQVDHPTHIVIVATSSIGGAQYQGGTGSTLYVDQFEMGYDLPE